MKEQRNRPVLLPLGIVVGVILILGASAYTLLARVGGTNAMLAQGVQAYQHGDKVTASSDFERVTREAPGDPMPHVYLARMAREVGNYTIANQELQAALHADRKNLTGLREYGALFLSQGNYDQARIWYLHALEVDPTDVASQGWLGCTLMKLGRADEGRRWLSRAGTGKWSACASAPAPLAPGNIRP
jgi:Tfp pilus assembly protein PilF